MSSNARWFALAAIAVGLAFPAFGEEGTSFENPHSRAPAADHAFHPAALAPEDQALAQRVTDQLSADPALQNTVVTVHVANGAVTLAGSPDNAAAAARAHEDAVRAAAGAPVSSMIP